MTTTVTRPIIGNGIRNTNYFQGRVLSAEDLSADQQADRRHRAQLGRAVGPGVVHGLEARIETAGPDPVISVEPGLAIDSRGGTIELTLRVSLRLFAGDDLAPGKDEGLFGPCREAIPGVDLSGDGAYVLLISPASAYRERAPKVGLGSDGIAGGCGARFLVEGAALRLAALPLAGRSDVSAEFEAIAALDDPSSTASAEDARRAVSRFRNALAHICLPHAAAAGQAPALRAGAPAVFDAPQSILAQLATGEAPPITPCDVPLAVFYIDLFGLRFVDRWSARRIARPRIPAETFSLFPAFGLERLLQFAEHLDDVADAAPVLSSVRIGDYFRYLPPAGWFAAQGSGTAGFSASQFLGAFTRGAVGRMPAGSAAELLERSLRHGAVDLERDPCLLVYEIDENDAAVGVGEAGRRVRLFASRAINAPVSRDGLALALERAWEVYRAFARRILQFGMPEDDPSRREVREAARAVAETASRYAAVAMAGRLDDRDTLAFFERFHALQLEVATRLGEVAFAGGALTTGFNALVIFSLNNFIVGFLARLNGTIPGTGGPGLAPAVAAEDVCAAIAAQDAINRYVGEFSGEAGASGPTEIGWVESPDGQVVVPGGGGFRHVYEIDNGTDRRLTFFLEASVEAPAGDWSGAVAITDTSGAPITQIAIDSGRSGRFAAAVAAPSDANIGDTVTLNVRAFVPPPESRDLVADPLELEVGDEAGGAVDRTIRIPEPADPQLEHAVESGSFLNLEFTLLYQAESGPDQATFEVAVDFEGSAEGWLVSIGDSLGTPETSPGRFAETLTLTAGARTPVPVSIKAPDAVGATASFRFEVSSIDLPEPISAASPPGSDRFTITTTEL